MSVVKDEEEKNPHLGTVLLEKDQHSGGNSFLPHVRTTPYEQCFIPHKLNELAHLNTFMPINTDGSSPV